MDQFRGQQQPGQQQLQVDENTLLTQIQVTVVVNIEQSNLDLQINIDPDIPFSVFVECIKKRIFALLMKSQYEETIEYQLLNGGNIGRTLAQLGFVNECTFYVTLTLNHCQEIDVRIMFCQPIFWVVTLVRINRNIPFTEFINGIKHLVIEQNEAEKQVEYELNNVIKIQKQEMRSLAELGFTQGCELIVKFISQPGCCQEHNKPITNVCIYEHLYCKNKLLCSECLLKHMKIKMPSLKNFVEQVQYNLIPFDIFYCSELLNQVKTLEINANLINSQFSYQVKRLIKSIENMNKEISNVKNNLENLWPERLSQKELEELLKYYNRNTLNDKKQYEQFTYYVLEQKDIITQSSSKLDQFKQTMDRDFPGEYQNIVVNIVVRNDEQEGDIIQNIFKTSIDPDIPFNVFIDTISSKLFKQNKQQEQIAYFKLDGNINIYQNEVKTLAELGFVNECMLLVTK